MIWENLPYFLVDFNVVGTIQKLSKKLGITISVKKSYISVNSTTGTTRYGFSAYTDPEEANQCGSWSWCALSKCAKFESEILMNSRPRNILTLVGRRKAGVPLLLRGINPQSAARSPLLRNAAEGGAIWLFAVYWRRTGAESTENRSGSPQSEPLPATELGSEMNCWGGKEEAPGQMCDDGTKRNSYFKH